ncbi:MAG: glycosyl transferase, partial [Mycobacteriaceae bacterium]|nr:glycosyl transferase [Mycobacteriaceae bacterium]
EVYTWRAADEQAVCASWIGKQPEAFTVWRRLLAQADLPEHERQRIATNRDVCVPTMLRAAMHYPDHQVQQLAANPHVGEVVCSLIAGPDRSEIEQTLNSFLHCCTDIERIGRFLLWDAGLSEQDRAVLAERYGFLEFYQHDPEYRPSLIPTQIPRQIHQRFWLHLGQGWRFFAPEDLITRLMAVVEAEPQVVQVAINLSDATTLTHISAPENTVRRGHHTGRYLLTDTVADGPALFDTTRLGRIGDPYTASLDEVLCIHSSAVDDA